MILLVVFSIEFVSYDVCFNQDISKTKSVTNYYKFNEALMIYNLLTLISLSKNKRLFMAVKAVVAD